MRGNMTNRINATIVALLLICGLAVPAGGADPAEEDLAELYPSSLDGRALEVETYRGPEWIARADPEEPGEALVIARTEELVAALGKDLADLTIGTALDTTSGGGISTITAVRVDGTRAWDFYEAAIELMLGDIESPRLTVTSVADKGILQVADEAMPGVYRVVVYPAGDTVWLVTADSRALFEEILAALPPVPLPQPSATPTVDLAEAFPSEVGGRPWPSEPIIVSGAEVILVLAPMPWSRSDLLDLGAEVFFATGAGLDDLTVALAAGDLGDDPRSYAFLGAYQIAGADEVVMREDLIDIFISRLARMAYMEDYPVEELLDTTTVAGRKVMRLGLGPLSEPSEFIHFYISGDTIWLIGAREESTLMDILEELPAG